MVEQLLPDPASTDTKRNPPRDFGSGFAGVPIRLIVWTVLSVAFVSYLAFGSVGAHIWRFGQLRVESRSIAATWRAQGQNLPEVAHQWLIESVFYGAILVFVVCVIVGMRLLLSESSNELASVDRDRL